MEDQFNLARQASNLRLSSSGPATVYSDLTCIVCFREARFFSVGPCDHGICLECSARMKVLIPQQNECAICRQELEHVIFTKNKAVYKEVKNKLRMFIFLPAYNIYMEDAEVEEIFNYLLEARCPFCDERMVFKSFYELKTHVSRTHDKHACDLCVEHIKLFPSERRFYSRSDLALHKRKGDKEDSSHKGHPLCKFCDRRYFDDDNLFKHLRKDHYFCHFCDSDGLNQFYNNYDDLRIHFRCDHYLCEEEHCKNEKFTSVFRTEIDLKAHLASVHSRLLGKQGVKQTRQIDVDFNQRRREPDSRRNDRRGGAHNRTSNEGSDSLGETNSNSASATIRAPVQMPTVAINLESANDFPTLGINVPGNSVPSASRPLISQASHANAAVAATPVYSEKLNRPISAKPNVKLSGPSPTSRPFRPSWNAKVTGSSKMDEEFPALMPIESTSATPSSSQNVGSSKTFKSITQAAPVVPRVLKTAEYPLNQVVPSNDEFPSLSGPAPVSTFKLPSSRPQKPQNTREYQGKRTTSRY